VEIERLLQNLIDKTVLFGHFQQNAAVFTPVSGGNPLILVLRCEQKRTGVVSKSGHFVVSKSDHEGG
jgi:hypothetical protein